MRPTRRFLLSAAPALPLALPAVAIAATAGPVADPAAQGYIAARMREAVVAHEVHNPAASAASHEAFCAASDRLLAEPATDLRGLTVRLGQILSLAFLHRAGLWDCPYRSEREAVKPVTDGELVAAAEGDNGGEDALFRALAGLHLQAERIAAQEGK